MIFKEDQIFDYIKCPAYYDMAYNKKIPISDEVSMQILLNIVVDYFYSNLLNKKILTIDELKRKWDSICEKNKNYIDNKKNLEGINYIINFARWSANNKILLADFKSQYEINIASISIIGNINAIAILPGKKCELIINRFSNQAPEQSDIDKNLKYTIDCYAFKKNFNYDITAIKIIHHKNNSEYTTHRTINDYDRLEATIKGVSAGIMNNSFYPRENIFCKRCFYKEYCKYWII